MKRNRCEPSHLLASESFIEYSDEDHCSDSQHVFAETRDSNNVTARRRKRAQRQEPLGGCRDFSVIIVQSNPRARDQNSRTFS